MKKQTSQVSDKFVFSTSSTNAFNLYNKLAQFKIAGIEES